jgi:hypothetical protein
MTAGIADAVDSKMRLMMKWTRPRKTSQDLLTGMEWSRPHKASQVDFSGSQMEWHPGPHRASPELVGDF